MGNKYQLTLGIAAIFLLMFSIGSVMAGISTPYWRDRPLEMLPGETKDIEVTLINGGEAEDNVEVSISEGSEYVQITTGSSYIVPPKSNTVKVGLRISIPQSASEGDVFDAVINAQPITTDDGEGSVQLGVSYSLRLPIQVVAEQAQEEVTPTPQKDDATRTNVAAVFSIVVVVVIIIIVVLVWWLLRRKG